MKRYYTGVGSRQTPELILLQMRRLAAWLRYGGYTLRSGGAEGADRAFASQAGQDAEIYLPWLGFLMCDYRLARPSLDAYRLAATTHPNWSKLHSGARALHARNCHEVLGANLDTPSEFLICWTPDGCVGAASRTRETGGTATAIILAERFGVEVYNLKNPGTLERLESKLVGQA